MDDRHLRALIGERHPASSPTALQQAEGYLTEEFKVLGLEVSAHPFKALGDTYRNVVGTRPASHPLPESDAPLIVAAHYDTVRGSPGADDNASALAVLLEVARCLRGVPLSREVRFIAFSLEEEDLLGSLAYVSSLKKGGHEIEGAIVLECVGYACATEGSQQKPAGVPIVVPTVRFSGDRRQYRISRSRDCCRRRSQGVCSGSQDGRADGARERRIVARHQAERPRGLLALRLSGGHADRHRKLPQPELPRLYRYYRDVGLRIHGEGRTDHYGHGDPPVCKTLSRGAP